MAVNIIIILGFATMFYVEAGCSDKITTAVGQGALFLSLIVSNVFQMRREARTRRWAKEDALELAKKTEQTAQNVVQATKDTIAEHETKMSTKVDEQTAELQRSMRTRVEDFGKNIEALLPPNTPKRRGSDGK